MSVEMVAEYVGELNCKLVHGPSGRALETDAPVDNCGRGLSFSPSDLLGASLVSCAMTTMAIKGPKAGISFESASGQVVKQMHSEGPRRVAELRVEIKMPGGLSVEDRASLERVARNCPVALSLHPDVHIPISFHYPD